MAGLDFEVMASKGGRERVVFFVYVFGYVFWGRSVTNFTNKRQICEICGTSDHMT